MSFAHRKEFGQEQPLTVALHKLVRDYPLSVGLFKEFIQNADDAGASEIRFILDHRQHPSTYLPHPNLSRLCGPALIICNDAQFTQQDLLNIQRLGDTQKAEAPAKIGRFGLGFNCCYNVTDYPELLTGSSLYLFDPHKTADEYSPNSKPGGCWDLTADLWSGSRDLLRPFSVAGLSEGSLSFNGTAFRLPLRTTDHIAINGKIRAEVCATNNLTALITEFETFAPSILLFLRTLMRVSFHEIKPGATATTELLSIETTNPEDVSTARSPLLSLLEGEFDTVLERLSTAPEKDLTSSYTHGIHVEGNSGKRDFLWGISTGFQRGAENKLLRLAQTMWQRKEKAIPWAGVAARLPSAAKSRGKSICGEVFCFLPLPDARASATIPVHIHGFFDVSSSRRGLTYETGAEGTTENLRAKWNHALIEDGVSNAYRELLDFILQIRPDIDAGFFYSLFPAPDSPLPDPLKPLTPAFYKRASESPFFRTITGSWGEAGDLRAIRAAIREPLVAEQCSIVPDPEIPAHIAAGLSSVEAPIAELSVPELQAFYKVEADPDCLLSLAPRPSLKNREWLSALLGFVLSEGDAHDLHGLPFLLTSDEKLHAFGLYEQTVFLAGKQQRRIFAPFPDWFVDEDLAAKSELEEMAELNVRAMTADDVVSRLKLIAAAPPENSSRKWAPATKELPNQKWLIDLSKYLVKQPQDWTPNKDDLDECCLAPGQFGLLHQCGSTQTPLLPLRSQGKTLLKAVTALHVGLITGDAELLTAIENLCHRFPDTMIWELTPRDLLQTLAESAEDLQKSAPDFKVEHSEAILEFLSSQEAIESYDTGATPWLEKLKTISLFPCEDGGLTSLTACQCFFPTSVVGPKVRLQVKLLKRGTWEPLLKKLQVTELTVQSLIEKALLPGYASLDEPSQVTTLLWIRDHLDQALTDAGPAQQPFLDSLQRAELVRASNGQLCAGRALYFPGENLVKEVMGDRALFPSMALYKTDPDRWLAFFTRLGMSRSPRPQDLADHILFLVGTLAQNADYEQTAARLTVVLQHLVDHWDDFQSASITTQTGTSVSFRDFVRAHPWCPPLRGQNNLRHLLVADEPPKRLFRLTELFPPALGHLVGGVHPLLPIRQREGVPDALRTVVPEVISPSLDVVVSHFEKLLAKAKSEEIEPKALKYPLRAIYSFFGNAMSIPATADPEEEESARLRAGLETYIAPTSITHLRTRLAQRPSIYVDHERRFRAADEVFFEDVPYSEPWWTQFHYKDGRVDLGLTALGRKTKPSFQDLCSLTVNVHQKSAGLLTETVARRFLQLLSRIDNYWQADGNIPQVFLLDCTLRTTPPADLLFDDAYWLPAQLDRSHLRLAHRDIPRSLAAKVKMTMLSERLEQRPKELTETDNDAFRQACARLQALVCSKEFAKGLQRIILKANLGVALPALVWLASFRLSPMARIVSEYLVHTSEGDLTLGESEDDTFWAKSDAGESILNVAESAINVMDVRLAETLKRQLGPIALDDIYLVKILGCADPAKIEPLLDQLKVPRLEEPAKPEQAAEGVKEGSDFLDTSTETTDTTDQEPKDEGAQAETEEPGKETTEPVAQEEEAAASEQTAEDEKADEQQEEDTGQQDKAEDQAGDTGSTRDEATDGGRVQSTGESEPGWERFDESHRRDRSKQQHPPRSRVVTYVLTNDQVAELLKKQDHANDEIPLNKRLGDDAVGWVLQYERQHGRKPTAKLHNNPGFDVESHDDEQPPRYIEVKGIRGGWGPDGVPVSVTQFKTAQEKGDQFWLYVVEFADDPESVEIHTIQNPVSHITQFRFDSGWRHLATHEAPFKPLLPAKGLRIRVPQKDGGFREGVIKNVRIVEGRQLMQVEWSNGHHGAVAFEPLKIEILPPAAQM